MHFYKIQHSTLFVLGLLFLSLQIACTPQKIIEATAPIAEDAPNRNLALTPFYHQESTLRYGIASDANNVIITVLASEPSAVGKMLFQGFTIGFNNEGKKKQILGIQYPIGLNSKNLGKQPNFQFYPGNTAKQNQEALQRSLDEMQEVMLFENGETDPGSYPIPMLKDIKVKLTATSFGGLLYELVISKKRLGVPTPQGEKLLAVNFKSESPKMPGGNAPDMSNQSTTQQATSGMNGGGINGMGNQMMNGGSGMQGPGGMPRNSGNQSLNFWFFVKLKN